jgi:protein-S-isoprenylcysteine O-methyltransferase Ste14
VLGDALVIFSFYMFYLVSKVNTYAAANIRVEEDQKVISTGMYGFVRHPMYFGALFLLVGTPLALGSWWALLLIPFALIILYSASRTKKRCSCALSKDMKSTGRKFGIG